MQFQQPTNLTNDFMQGCIAELKAITEALPRSSQYDRCKLHQTISASPASLYIEKEQYFLSKFHGVTVWNATALDKNTESFLT